MGASTASNCEALPLSRTGLSAQHLGGLGGLVAEDVAEDARAITGFAGTATEHHAQHLAKPRRRPVRGWSVVTLQGVEQGLGPLRGAGIAAHRRQQQRYRRTDGLAGLGFVDPQLLRNRAEALLLQLLEQAGGKRGRIHGRLLRQGSWGRG
jgi:hypothetical protein